MQIAISLWFGERTRLGCWRRRPAGASEALLLALLALALVAGSRLCAADPNAADLPERVIVNLTAQPATSMAVTWRTAAEHANAAVEFAVATDTAEFAKATKKVAARAERFETDKGAVFYHYSAVLDGLTPGTRYAYRAGHDAAQSEWNQFETARAEPAPFRFVWFGDPQDNIAEHCSRTFREAYRAAPDARFWLFSGDLCSTPEDYRWGELFYAAGFVFRALPSIATPGNHDMGYLVKDGAFVLDEKGRKKRSGTVSATWRAHFTLPENGPPGGAETSYQVDYQGVRFILINSNLKLDEQAAWLETVLASNPNPWTVVAFHHPLYSTGQTRDGQSTRNAFLPLFDRYAVDLVLTGHDHTYARSHKLRNNQVASPGEKGTVYVVSSSGPKRYVLQPLYQNLMAKTGEGLMLFHPLAVDGRKLTFEARTAAGNVYDSFVLSK